MDEYDDDVPSTSNDNTGGRQRAIETTAAFLLNKLTADNVAQLVLVSMVG